MPYLAALDKNGGFLARLRCNSCLPSSRKDADKQTQAKGNAYGFIRMLTDATVGRLCGGDGLFFQPLGCFFGRIDRRR